MQRENNRNIKTVLRLFPYLEDKNKASKLKIDSDSIYYISLREHAEQISSIISNHLLKLNIHKDDAVITDATAGVGGNTISFARNFKYVNAIEIDEKRTEFLHNNINVYGIDNVSVINRDCTKVLAGLDSQNVVFIDPPWGGKNYKNYNKLTLRLSNTSIEMMCNHLMDDKIMKHTPDIIVLKLPINYDLKYLYKVVKSESIYLHNLGKMSVIVIINTNKHSN